MIPDLSLGFFQQRFRVVLDLFKSIFNAYNQATQSGLISEVGCALPHPLTYTNHHIDPQPSASICTDLAMSTSARLQGCQPPDPHWSNVHPRRWLTWAIPSKPSSIHTSYRPFSQTFFLAPTRLPHLGLSEPRLPPPLFLALPSEPPPQSPSRPLVIRYPAPSIPGITLVTPWT